MTWNETAPADHSSVAFGYHILPSDGSAAFDLYSDVSGRLVDAERLSALGIVPKDWNLRPQEAPPETPRPEAAAMPKPPVPLGAAGAVAPAATIDLPVVDLAKTLEEDEAGTSVPNKGVVRIGVFQDLPQPIAVAGDSATVGEWRTMADGVRVWAVTIHSPDAIGIRVHFPELRLPSGGRVLVYNAHDPSECYGPYVAPYPGDNEVWAATCFSDAVVVECSVPAKVPSSEVSLRIDRAIHVYRGFDSLQWAKAASPAASSAGSCNLDVTCYSAWSTTARGVGGIGTVGSTGYLWCTGSLLVDNNPATNIPYFLTAHHCVGGQSGYRGADSIEVYWLYQTPTCNGTPPSPGSVLRTTGAVYLAGSGGDGYSGGGNDFTLLRLRHTPPPGLTYLGWSSAAPPLGTQITCIHHPRGDFKRIAFGALDNQSNPYSALYHEVHYGSGTTEPGSSGCPLMLEATGQIIGQLWGGTASCAYPTYPDYYGRFDVTFPVVKSYLAPLGVVYFTPTSYTVSENGAVVTVTVRLSVILGGGQSAQVNYATSNGTAEAGKDYQAASGTLTFEGAQQTQTFTVAIYDDTHTEPDETMLLTLSNPVGCLLWTPNASATITMNDDDPDTDGDGLSDYDETHGVYGYITDPNNRDTDGDGISDYDEIFATSGLKSDPTQFTVVSALSVPFFREAPAP